MNQPFPATAPPPPFVERLQTPIWVFDIESERMTWANGAALELWNAADVEELCARDFSTDMTEAVRTRLGNYLKAFARGETRAESWTFFPRGEPVTVFCHSSAYPLEDGRLGMLVEGTLLNAIDAPTLRAIESLRHTPVMISVYDGQGRLLSRNPAAEAALGPDGGPLGGHLIDTEVRQALETALQRRGSCEFDTWVETRQGRRWHNLIANRVPDPEGQGEMVVISEVDMTEARESLNHLAESEQRLHEITDVLGDGVYVLDAQGLITFCNPAAQQILGWSEAELLGQNAHRLFHSHRADGEPCREEECPTLRALHDGRVHRRFEETFIRRDGSSVPVSMVASPIVRNGKVVGAVAAFHDSSERKVAEAALRESEQSLARAQRIAHVGNWEWDIASGAISWTDEAYRIFGFAPGAVEPTYEAFLARLHPDERAGVERAVQRALEVREPYAIEHRIVRPDGSERVVFEQGEVELDQVGRPRHMTGTVQDITERKRAELALQSAQRRLAALIENLRGGVLVEDEQRRILLVNQAFCDIFAIPAAPEQLIGADCVAAAEQSRGLFAEPERFVARVNEILDRRRTVIGEEWTMADGRVFERDYVPVYVGDEYHGHLWQYWEITERKRAEEESRRLATTDTLTELANRRHILERTEQALAHCRRTAEPSSLLLIDLDHFKRVNDTWGHAAGDQVLVAFARLLRESVREVDLPGRIGGEEFLLLLDGTPAEGAVRFAERLRQQVAALRIEVGGQTLALTASIGVSALCQDDASVESALARADQALYAAKAAGRDRVCVQS